MEIRNFGKSRDVFDIPTLTDIQTRAFAEFLQEGVSRHRRKNQGLEAILREIFPIESYDKTMSLEFLGYELSKPRYTPDECRKLHLTYGRPFRVYLRLNKAQPIEEDVYLGEIPIMMGGGEFVVNGAERVIVSQLHRSPGVDFLEEGEAEEKKLQSCRIIPERGSWVEINVTKKDVIVVRIDQSGKLPVTCLLRAMSEKLSSNAQILRAFYQTRKFNVNEPRLMSKIRGMYALEDIMDEDGETVLVKSGTPIRDDVAGAIKKGGKRTIELVPADVDPVVLNSLAEDTTTNHEEALLFIYKRLRPGNPAKIDKARDLFHEKFFDPNRYRLGRVGRFRINRKFGQSVPETEMTLREGDLVNSIRYLLRLRVAQGEVDDIDHLGNRRLRTIDELAGDEIRKGFLKLRRTVQERMSLKEPEDLTPRTLVNSKTISSAIEYFFGRGELSQVVDQTNPLAQLTHERRLSALGPGGLNRKRAGFEVRDVHISHYGRICPIETPEGTNIGLISSLSLYASVDDYGFLVTPYRAVRRGKVTDRVRFLRADEEIDMRIAPADTPVKANGEIIGDSVPVRLRGDFMVRPPSEVDLVDVSPKQLVGVSASLIPFLEHNDANRALMGSNMQRQAVPLLKTEPPIVATGIERSVAVNSGMVIRAANDGVVKYVDARRIVIGDQAYELRKFVGLNERTCLNQRPIVKEGDRIRAGDVIADGAGTCQGELALGKNVLVAFMTFDGYNFEDAIIISEELVHEDAYTSIHIEEFEIEVRETKLGREEFTRDIPNVSEKALRNLDEDGVILIGTKVHPGDVLVGKVSPKSKSELSPEEKLLHAIFGKAGEDVKNDSLEVPSGVEGMVIGAEKFSRVTHLPESKRREADREIKRIDQEYQQRIIAAMREMIRSMEEAGQFRMRMKDTGLVVHTTGEAGARELLDLIDNLEFDLFEIPASARRKARTIYDRFEKQVEEVQYEREREVGRLRRGDELPPGVLEMVKVYVATKRTLSVGDKMAGRHGNKGVIAKILPEEDMPFLEDGTPVQILLNPLGVPSRMNVGQILETHLGWAAKALGWQAVSPVFAGANEDEIKDALEEASLPRDGQAVLFDGRTGEPLDQKVTVGYIYMMKLHHLVDDKVHARATGPYSLITQQPLGGKARFGGQRFGEMEVWALEAYGAAYILQELLTVKSDDVEGRTRIYESMVKGENTLEAGTPVSFEVLTNEIRGLGLNIQLEKSASTTL